MIFQRYTSRRSKFRQISALLIASAVVVPAAACSGSGGTPAQGASGQGASCNTPGVSANSIQLGSLVDQTGAVSSVWAPFAQGVQARVDYQNAQGGIHGRKLVLTAADDASTTAQNLSGAQQLVEGHDVLAVLEGSSFGIGSAAYLAQNNVPVSGFGFSAEWQQYKNNFVSFSNVNPGVNDNTTVTKLWGQILKAQGVTNVFVAGSSSPGSYTSTQAYEASVKANGLKVGAVAADVPLATTDYGAEVAQAKAAGVNGAAITVTPQAAFAMIAALRQAGVKLNSILLSTGYDPSVFHSGVNLENVTINLAFAPFEDNLPAQKTFSDAMTKYEHGDARDAFAMYGWLAANLIIQGIKGAGACPTRQGVLNAITALHGYTAGGLIPPTDFSLATRGQVLKCTYFVTVHNNKFVPDNNGQPVCVNSAQYWANF